MGDLDVMETLVYIPPLLSTTIFRPVALQATLIRHCRLTAEALHSSPSFMPGLVLITTIWISKGKVAFD